MAQLWVSDSHSKRRSSTGHSAKVSCDLCCCIDSHRCKRGYGYDTAIALDAKRRHAPFMFARHDNPVPHRSAFAGWIEQHRTVQAKRLREIRACQFEDDATVERSEHSSVHGITVSTTTCKPETTRSWAGTIQL
jgi:hypothetical protein